MFLFLNLKFSGVENRRKYKKRLKNISVFFLFLNKISCKKLIMNTYSIGHLNSSIKRNNNQTFILQQPKEDISMNPLNVWLRRV